MNPVPHTYLDITSPPIKIQMQILNISILGKEIRNVLLGSFFVDICRDHDPAFDAADGDGVFAGFGFCVIVGVSGAGGGGFGVNG